MELTNGFDLIGKLLLNIAAAFIIVDLVYKKFNKGASNSFILYSFNFILFIIAVLLSKIELSIGSGFGLFAVFTMIRYRSEQLNVKEIAYLLLVAGLALVNAIASQHMPFLTIAAVNILAIGLIVLFESRSGYAGPVQKIKYDKPELLKPQFREYLKKDLMLRLGKEIEEIRIENINFIEGVANLKIRTGADYFPSEGIMYSRLIQNHQNELKKLLRENTVKFPIHSSLN